MRIAIAGAHRVGKTTLAEKLQEHLPGYTLHAINETKDIRSFFDKAQTIITGIDLLVFVPVEEPDLIPCQKSDLPALSIR